MLIFAKTISVFTQNARNATTKEPPAERETC